MCTHIYILVYRSDLCEIFSPAARVRFMRPRTPICMSSVWSAGVRTYHVDNIREESIRLSFTIVIHCVDSRVTQRLRRRKRALVTRRKSTPALTIEDDIQIRFQFRCKCYGEICVQIPTVKKLALRVADEQYMPHRYTTLLPLLPQKRRRRQRQRQRTTVLPSPREI